MARYREVAFAFGPPLTRMVKYLILVTSATFLLTYVPAQIFGWALPFEWFSLQPHYVVHNLYLWQLFTYLFLHWGWFHIIFNMFALWMFGADLEAMWGPQKFLFFYFLTGVGAGILDVVVNTLFSGGATATMGCSGAVYGLLLAYGLTFPERPIYLYLLIPVKAKWFVLIMGLIEFVSSFGTPGSGISHVAHLGGMLFGFAYLRGADLPFRVQLRYHEWRRARLRRKFQVYMRDQERKQDPGRWVN